MKFRYFLLIAVIAITAVSSYFLYKHYVNSKLIEAVKSNDIETAKTALKWGADVDYRHGGFLDPAWHVLNTLGIAIQYGHPEMVQFLLDNGVSMNIQDGNVTALEYSQDIQDGNLSIVAPQEDAERWQTITVPKQQEIIPILEREVQKRTKE